LSHNYRLIEITEFTDPRIKLSYWYPQLDSRIPTPDTEIIPSESLDNYSSKIGLELSESEMKEVIPPDLLEDVRSAYRNLNAKKVHLRSDWKSSIFTDDREVLWSSEITHILEELHHLRTSLIMSRFPATSIVLRDYLDLEPLYVSSYGPDIYSEVRFIIEEGTVCNGFVDIHKSDFVGASNTTQEEVVQTVQTKLESDYDLLEKYANYAAQSLPESSWSIDFVEDSAGDWYCVDMSLYGIYWSEDKNRWHNISHIPENNPYNPVTQRTDKIPQSPPQSKD